MHNQSPIGVFDSGIGGLTVASAIAERLPMERIVYFGDTANCPYGDKVPREVIRLSCDIVDFLIEQNVKMVVVACNTATAVALPTLANRVSIPILGVIQPGARAAIAKSATRRIGVIGTSVTIATGAYEQAILQRDPSAEVYSLACPPFVPLVEEGLTDGPEVETVVRQTLAPLADRNLDALILGCTHYPLLSPVIARVMGPTVQLISSADETALEVKSMLTASHLLNEATHAPGHHYYTSGTGQRMATALERWQLALPGDNAPITSIPQITIMKAIG